MHTASFPRTDVCISICVNRFAGALVLPFNVTSNIYIAVGERVASVSLHRARDPFSPVNVSIHVLSNSVPVVPPVSEAARVGVAVRVACNAFAVLPGCAPLSFIDVTGFCGKLSSSAHVTFDEFSFVLVSVRVVNVSDAMSASIAPLTLVLAAVGPVLLSTAMLDLDAVHELELS